LGKVIAHLRSLIEKQVGQHGIVVWYDPERHYEAALPAIGAASPLVRYQGSFIALRKEVDPLIEAAEAPPSLIVYVPLDPAAAHHALVEIEALGVVMKPGQQPTARNTRLAVVARGALRGEIGEQGLAEIEGQIDAGKLGLEDLDRKADGAVGQGVLSVIFRSGAAHDVALVFLGSRERDAAIEARKALPELIRILEEAFEAKIDGGASLDAARRRFARHVLAADLTTVAQGELPSSVSTVPTAAGETARHACVSLAAEWRQRRDLRAEYEAQAESTARELGLVPSELQFAGETLSQILAGEEVAPPETFLEVEQALQIAAVEQLERTMLEASPGARTLERLIRFAVKRKRGFWSECRPEVQAQWALIAALAQVAFEALRVERELKACGLDAQQIAVAYTREEGSWCLLDTRYREMEKLYHGLDLPAQGDLLRIDPLVSRARFRYMQAGSAMAEAFARGYARGRFQLPGFPPQKEVFDRAVKPALAEGKTAYVLVDALRFEMAQELARGLAAGFDLKLEPALASMPTITEVGMASLLPLGGDDVVLELGGRERLTVKIGAVQLRDRKARVAFLKEHAGSTVFESKLEDFLPGPRRKVTAGVAAAELVLVTSQEIDELAERDNVSLARRFMDEVLPQLRRLFRSLVGLGVQTIVLAADHGYLFGDEIASDMKIPPPGGETVALKRRVWVGRGGAASDAYLRARIDDLGLAGDLEIATPWGFGCFEVQGGASAYFHGGLSPQELIIPVLVAKPRRSVQLAGVTNVEWSLTPGSPKVSTRLFSVEVRGAAKSFFSLEAPRVRLELRAGKEVLTTPVSASYGLDDATGDVQLKISEKKPGEIEPNTVALRVIQDTAHKAATLHLLDAATGAELKRIDTEISISI
jgi:hypothetical protein